jgi:hypothetical protein
MDWYHGSMTQYYVGAVIGAILAVIGYLGPEDGGTLELIGLAILAVALYKLFDLNWF